MIKILSKKISYICQNEYNYFLNKKYVVGIALGYKICNGFSTFKKCITVFVIKKLPLKNLSKENIVPKCYKGIITDVIESGVIKVTSLTSKVRPVIQGYSIGNVLSGQCGTCGCLVHDKFFYILSSNHVLALSNSAPLGSDILQPSVYDGGEKKDIIGHLHRFIPIQYTTHTHTPENTVDCALCKVINNFIVSSKIAFLGTPKGSNKPSLDLNVQKVGRMTELTHGKITNLHGTTLVINKIQQKALFKDQIITTKMSESGDSGALLLTENLYAIGLLMSGEKNLSIFNPIDNVLKELKVELVTS